MKPLSNSFLRSAFIGALLAATAHAADLTWDNGATTGLWNTTDANWTAATWNNATPDNAILNGTAPGTINLGENITAGTLTFATASAYTLDANGKTLTVNGDIQVAGTGNAQSGLTLTNGTFNINRIVTKSTDTGDWGVVNIDSGAVVTASTGIDGSAGSAYTFALNLNGGSLYTPSIKVADLHETWGNSFLTFNGTEVFATTADNADFIQTYGGFGNNNTLTIASGAAILNSNGFNTGITKNLITSCLFILGCATSSFAAYTLTNGNFATNDSTGWTTSGSVSATSGAAVIGAGGLDMLALLRRRR